MTDAIIDEIADGAWRLASHAAPGRRPLELLTCLIDPPALSSAAGAAEFGPLEQRATMRFLFSDATQRLLAAAVGILRNLTSGPHEDPGGSGVQGENDSRMHAGLVDWSATLIRRMASGGQRTAVVMRRPEVQRDLPKNRLLRFILLEIERSAKILSRVDTLEHSAHGRLLQLASRAARLAHHPLLETVPAAASREGLRDATRSPLADDRSVARAYELYEGFRGRGNRELLVDTVRDTLRSSVPLSLAAALLVYIRAVDAVRFLLEGVTVTVRPLPAHRGLVAICRAGDRAIDVTLSREALPDPGSATPGGLVAPEASHTPSCVILLRATTRSYSYLQLMTAVPTADASALDLHAELLERHVRIRWPELRGWQERILVDCATAGRHVTQVAGRAFETYVTTLAALPEIVGRVAQA